MLVELILLMALWLMVACTLFYGRPEEVFCTNGEFWRKQVYLFCRQWKDYRDHVVLALFYVLLMVWCTAGCAWSLYIWVKPEPLLEPCRHDIRHQLDRVYQREDAQKPQDGGHQ